MRQMILTVICFLVVTPALVHCQEKKDETKKTASIVGTWQGKLDVAAVSLRIQLNISEKDGKLSGTMDSPDQGVKGIPIGKIEREDKNVTLEWPALKAKFVGTLNKAGDAMKGEWQQSGIKIATTFKRSAKPFVYRRPQEPKGPFPYRSEDVTFKNNQAKITLSGTLTLPKGKGPFPAVILISGSGPQDRNSELFGHKPFLVMADHLTKNGIAVLRYDERGVGKSEGDISKADSRDFAADVTCAFQFLRTRKDIAKNKIGLIGHSEGGLIAPMVAAKNKDVAFIVLMAGPGFPGDVISRQQVEVILKQAGVGPEDLKFSLKMQAELFRIAKEKLDEKEQVEAWEKFVATLPKDLPEEQTKAIKNSRGELKRLNLPWYRYFLTYDPRPTLAKVQCPVLAINGAKDVQVLADVNLAEIRKALEAGKNPDFTIKNLQDLNHLFQPAKTGAITEYAQIETTLAPKFLDLITEWIKERTKAKS